MTRRFVIVAACGAACLLSAFAAPASDQPKAAAAQAPALSADQTAKLNRLRALPPPDTNLTLSAAAAHLAIKATAVKKEVSCGVYLSPPNPNPGAVSPRLFFVNTTGQALPAGVKIDWEVEGAPASCCKGVGWSTAPWAPNPPSPLFLASGMLLSPPQPWTRSCKAWVTMP